MGLRSPFGEMPLEFCPLTPRYLDRFVPFLELRDIVRVDSFSTVAMQCSLDQSESITSIILGGNS